MACTIYPSHCIALNIYIVDSPQHETVENLTTAFGGSTQNVLTPVLQVRATRAELLSSVLYRAETMLRSSGTSVRIVHILVLTFSFE
jgi:hypothetical protein